MSYEGEVLLWLDVETTGLDPVHGKLLEVAIVPTAMEPGFEQIAEPFSEVIFHGRDLNLMDVSPEVLAMHGRSGLWADSRGANGIEHCWPKLRQAMAEWGIGDGARYLAGRSVHFDRSWLRAKAPADLLVDLNFSHRHFDLTAIKAFVTLTEGFEFGVPEDAHRALPDVLADIELARKLVALVRAGR